MPPSRFSSSDAHELLAIASSLNSVLDLDTLLQKIGHAAERLLDSEASSILLLDDSKRLLYFKVAGGPAGPALKRLTVPIGQGIAGLAASTRTPILVADALSDERVLKTMDRGTGWVTRSLLAAPMLCRGELLGVAEVLNKREGTYTPEDQVLLSSVAGLAAVAVANAKLIQSQKNFFSHVLEILKTAIEASRPRMLGHPQRAARLACAIGKSLGLEEEPYRALYHAGLLHDIGYVGLRDPALPGGEEAHPQVSVKMLEGITLLQETLPLILHHHERFDGQGFPSKLAGEALPLGARILALVESVEELRMATGLRGEALKARALQEVKNGSGTRFDPRVARAFAELLATDERCWEI